MERTFLWVPKSDPFGEQWLNCEFVPILGKKPSWWTTESGGDCHSYSIGAIKKGKAVGPDGIRGRSIQGCWSSSHFRISMLTSGLWVPLIVSIFKKGDKTNCGNHPCFLLLESFLLVSLHTASSPLPKRPFQSLHVVSDQHKGLLTRFSQHDRFRKSAKNRPLYSFHWSD